VRIAISMTRAAALRALIISVMACLDAKGTDRASVGQPIHMFDPNIIASATAFQRAKETYDALVKTDLFECGKRLRDEEIAHKLPMDEPIPDVPYETFYELHDKAQQITIDLFQACDRGRPKFLTHQQELQTGAKTFWDRYIKGMPE
jgi:hypothetical protein